VGFVIIAITLLKYYREIFWTCPKGIGGIMSHSKSLLLILLLAFLAVNVHAINDMPVIASFQGEHHRSAFGYSMVSLDFNLDGLDDLAICSPNYGYIYPGTTDPGHGKLYLYYGVNGFNSNTYPALTYEGSFDGSSGRVVLGIFRVGDISGDGFDDLCMYVEDHISWNESYEKLLFFYGDTPNLDNPDHVINLWGNIYTFYLFFALGDVNGDGFDDMGIVYKHSPSYQNRLSIIWGGTFTEQVVSAGEASSAYSVSINGIGDINNDGYDDFATGFATPSSDATHNLIRLYYGNASGNTDDPINFVQSTSGISRGCKPLGDMNADGYDDFMGDNSNEGMHAWLGGTGINITESSFDMDPAWCGGEFQRSLEHGDFNNDGYEDAVGASFGSGFAVWLGKQHVNGTSDYIQYNPGYENFGYSLVTGDFNADGYADIAIAASHEYAPQPSGNYTGYVWVYAGNALLEDTTVANDDPLTPAAAGQLSIRLSPNPLTLDNQSITVSLKGSDQPEQDPLTIEIYNIKGQCVYKEINQAHSGNGYLITPDLHSNGIYFCKVQSGKQTAITKFTVVH